MSLQPGQTIAHYRLLELIGEGGMGRVFRAFDARLNRPVAIKILRPDLTSDEKLRKRFLREARAAAAVSHPAIAAVHEVAESGDLTYIVMEYVEGRTLRKMLQGEPLPLMETLRIAVEIAEGLAEAHRAGVVHRDLKPDNIIVRPDRRPKILDFGIAKLLEERSGIFRRRTRPSTTSLSGEGKIMGTLGYMSPEQARGDAVDARTDVFSLGVILYEMVTGRAPFRGRTPIDTLTSILKEPPPPASQVNPGVHPKVEETLAECLEKDPARRCQRMEDLVASLRIAQLALQEAAMRRTTFEGPALREPVPRAPAPAPGRRWPGRLVAVVGLVGAGALASALYLRGGSSPPAPGGTDAKDPSRAEAGGSSFSLARTLTGSGEALQHYAAGELALHQGRRRDAAPLLESAVRIDPGFVLARYRLSMALSGAGDAARAAAVLLDGLPHAGRLPDSWGILYRARLQWLRGETDAAHVALSGLLDEDDLPADVPYLLAEIHERDSRHEDPSRARALLERALDLDPGFRIALEPLVHARLAAGDLQGARRLLEGMAGGGDGGSDASGAEMAVRLAEGRIEEAVQLGEGALERGDERVRVALAAAHVALGDVARAADLAAAGSRESAESLAGRGWLLAQVGRLREALDVLREARDSSTGTVFSRLGAFASVSSAQILEAAGDPAAARRALEECLLADPHYAPAYYWLGRLHLSLGERAESASTLARLRGRIDEATGDPGPFWILVLQAEIHREEGDLGAALAALGRAGDLPAERRNPEVLAFTEARVKASFGDLDGAIEAYRRGLRPLPWRPSSDRVATPLALGDMALLEERSGDAEAARRHLRRLLDLWGGADLPVAAIAAARERLAALER